MITIEQVRAATPERFWNKIKFGEPNECWEWQASTARWGYGQWGVCKNWVRKNHVSHRFMFTQLFGDIPHEIFVLHKCDNPKCVNPNHLFTGTDQENKNDMKSKGRSPKGTEHWNAKLTDDDVMEIKRRLNKGGETYRVIGDLFGVDQGHIGMIATRKRWGHIQIPT